jgi:hypothetical protein
MGLTPEQILEQLRGLTGTEFEEFVASFFKGLGYAVDWCGGSGDGGIDLIVAGNERRLAIQCKQQQDNIAPVTVREFIGALWCSDAQEGYFMTTSDFSPDARATVEREPVPDKPQLRVTLMSGVQVVRSMEASSKQAQERRAAEEAAKTEAEAAKNLDRERWEEMRFRERQRSATGPSLEQSLRTPRTLSTPPKPPKLIRTMRKAAWLRNGR